MENISKRVMEEVMEEVTVVHSDQLYGVALGEIRMGQVDGVIPGMTGGTIHTTM